MTPKKLQNISIPVQKIIKQKDLFGLINWLKKITLFSPNHRKTKPTFKSFFAKKVYPVLLPTGLPNPKVFYNVHLG